MTRRRRAASAAAAQACAVNRCVPRLVECLEEEAASHTLTEEGLRRMFDLTCEAGYWSNTGQIPVKYRSNTGQILVKFWSNAGQSLGNKWSQTWVEYRSNTGQILVKLVEHQ